MTGRGGHGGHRGKWGNPAWSAANNLGRRRAAGIYGAIITAAILDTAGRHLPTAALVVSVVVTLLVYWLAEEYAEPGSIVAINSINAVAGLSDQAIYAAAKAAVNSLVTAAAVECGPYGTRVNVIAPGSTRTAGSVGA